MHPTQALGKWVSTFILLFTLWTPACKAQPLGILLLFSYEPIYPTAQLLTQYLNQALQQEIDQPFQLYIEYLDADIGTSEQYLADYRQLLHTKQQQNSHYDIVIAVGNSALSFAANENQELFNNSPLIFVNVSDQALVERIQARSSITGVMNIPPMHQLLELLQQLYPKRTSYYAIDDGLSHRQNRKLMLQQAADKLGISIELLRLDQLTWEELSTKLGKIEHQPIILLSAYQDSNGRKRHSAESNYFLGEHSSSPVWHPWQVGIGYGLTGGVVTDLKQSAQISAQMTAQVLHGTNVSDIPISTQPPLITLVDASKAISYGLALKSFPKDTTFINRPTSFWHLYGAFIIISISTISLILLLLFFAWRETLKRRDSEKKLIESNNLISYLLDAIPDLIYFKDTQGTYRFCNQNFIDLTKKDPLGITDFEIFEPAVAENFRKQDLATLAHGKMDVVEEWLTLANGDVLLYETRKTPIFDNKNNLQGIFGLSRDITDLKKAQKSLEFIAHHDSLTGLINRLALSEKTDFAINNAHRNQEKLAVIYLDLDRFKDVNDSIGHDVGDLLLKEVAKRLQKNLRESDVCSRLGGDEFIIVLTQISDLQQVKNKVDRLLQIIAQPYQLNKHLISIYSSAGISIYPENGSNSTELIKHADAALHKAKELGRNRYCLYEPSLTKHIYSRLVLDKDLRKALKNNQFYLNYQPIFAEDSKTIKRIEVLVRWLHPKRGIISPLEFIPIAETSGLITDLGFWVMKEACQQFLLWKSLTGNNQLERLAINISPIQINSNFAPKVTNLLREVSFDPSWLEMEVTESLMMSDSKEVIEQIEELKALGVHFSIDDFGTGYSSLSKLKSMPVSTLKIDQSFVQDINTDNNDYEIVLAIIQMAKSLNLVVIAEGIETKEQADTLLNLGCPLLQGYYYAKPMSNDQLGQHFTDNI